jgi:hypothetical protein
MELSVLIVTYNSSPYIEACLRSFQEPLNGIDHEIIVVDNHSRDETCSLLKTRFPGVILIENTANRGFGAANNLGLQRARGEFVLLLNPDIAWKKGEIRKAFLFLRDHPEAGGLGCRLVFPDGAWQRSHGNFPTLRRETQEAFYLPRIFPGKRWGVFLYREPKENIPVDWIAAAFFLAPKRLLLEVGGFDDRFFMYYEDIDLSRRIREKRKTLYYYPDLEVVHDQRLPELYDFGESPYLYFNKHFGLSFAEKIRYLLLMKTLLRMVIFAPLAFFTGKKGIRQRLAANYRTFKYHLLESPRVLKRLRHESEKGSY